MVFNYIFLCGVNFKKIMYVVIFKIYFLVCSETRYTHTHTIKITYYLIFSLKIPAKLSKSDRYFPAFYFDSVYPFFTLVLYLIQIYFSDFDAFEVFSLESSIHQHWFEYNLSLFFLTSIADILLYFEN